MKTVTVSVPGRICFAGEKLDYLSKPSIMGAINLRLKVSISSMNSQDDYIILESAEPFNISRLLPFSQMGVYTNHVLDCVQAAVKVFFENFSKPTPIHIKVVSALPANAGLSSSAAVIVGTIASLDQLFQTNLSIYDICNLAYSVESTELKTGAGQMDFYVCAIGGVIYLNCAHTPPNPIEEYTFPNDLKVMIVDTLTPHDTSAITQIIQKRVKLADPLIVEYLVHTELAVELMRNMFFNNEFDSSRFGSVITTCHHYIRDYMQVSTRLADFCVDKCLEYGALGAKLTGSGLGGCIFALVTESTIKEIKDALKFSPVRTYLTTITNQGLIIS